MATGFTSSNWGTSASQTGTSGAFGRSSTGTMAPIRFGTGAFGTTPESLVKEDTLIKDIPISDDPTKDARRGQRQIVLLHTIQREYDTLSRIPLQGEDAFNQRLAHLESDIANLVEHGLAGLASEVDRGNDQIGDYRDLLERARREVEVAGSAARAAPVAPLLQRYAADLARRKSALAQQLDVVDGEARAMRTSELVFFYEALKQQISAIIGIGARFAKIEESVGRGRERTGGRRTPEFELGRSQLAQIKEKYERFLDDRRRDLAKRNTDPEPFKDPATTGGFGAARTGSTGSVWSFQARK